MLVLTSSPPHVVKDQSHVHYSDCIFVLDGTVINGFNHSTTAEIMISLLSLSCSVTTCTVVLEHHFSGRSYPNIHSQSGKAQLNWLSTLHSWRSMTLTGFHDDRDVLIRKEKRTAKRKTYTTAANILRDVNVISYTHLNMWPGAILSK